MKTTYRSQLMALCFFMGALFAFSQNPDWSAQSPLVSINGTQVEINSTLTKQGATLTWEQNGYNTDQSMSFSVTAASGSWDAQNQLGTLSYDLALDGDTATLTVLGTEEGITMTFTVLDTNGNTVKTFEFDIDSLSNL